MRKNFIQHNLLFDPEVNILKLGQVAFSWCEGSFIGVKEPFEMRGGFLSCFCCFLQVSNSLKPFPVALKGNWILSLFVGQCALQALKVGETNVRPPHSDLHDQHTESSFPKILEEERLVKIVPSFSSIN